MQERLSLLLKLTAFFVFQFWLMIVNHYSLRGSLLGLPATAVVGSSAIALLAFLIVKVRQPTALAPIAIFSPLGARFALVFLLMWSGALVVIPVGVLLFCLQLVVIIILLVLVFSIGRPLSPTIGSIDSAQLSLGVQSLLGIVFLCIAIVFFFNVVASLVRQAALSKAAERVVYTLQAIGLVLVLALLLGKLQDFHFGSRLLCSKAYLSPSGQRAIVVEDYKYFGDDAYYSHAYLDGLIFRKDLGDFPNGFVCRQQQLTFNWSADEWHVDWGKLLP
ncbi:MAG: hypothetical protein KME45_05480 [Stenomitos rutilans HA7619-LM2]|jgi:hypothetical protein|nr:hypothetical protein [Stenomitos rutilans HA7619-LM2]